MNIKLNRNLKIVLTSLVLTLIAVCILGIMTLIGKSANLKILNNSTMLNTLLEIIIFFAQYLVLKIYNNGKFSSDYIGMRPHKNIFHFIVLGTALGAFINLVIFLFLLFTHNLDYRGLGINIYSTATIINSTVNAFIMAIFAGICEEIFFRGVLLNYLSKYKGQALGLIISSILFSVFHITRYNDFIVFIWIFIAGLILGYCFIITKSLYLSIALHFAIDFFSFITSIDSPELFMFSIGKNISFNYFYNVYNLVNICFYLILFGILVLISTKIKKTTIIND